jgi:hypothetical protein
MLRAAVANTAGVKVTHCGRGASRMQENAGDAALGRNGGAADRFAASLKPVIAEMAATARSPRRRSPTS